MFLVEVLRFFTGFVEFTAVGGFSERFINLCSVYDIPLWNVTYHDGYFTACSSIEGYLKIPICARNSGARVKRNRSVGIPFIINRLRPRIGLLIGTVFFFVCLSILSNRVWIVDIRGNEAVPTDVILSAAEKSGLKIGENTNSLNVVQLSLDTCERVDSLSWAAIRVNSCCVYIDVTESDSAPQIENKDGTYNVVASKDAQLIILEPYRGTAQAKSFNSVLKGDTLISGITINRDESASFVHASGYAVGRTQSQISAETDRVITHIAYTPIKKIYTIEFFGISIPIGKEPIQYDRKFTQTQRLSYNNKNLPVGITFTEYFSSSEVKNTVVSKEAAKLISASELMNSAYDFSKGKQILESDINLFETEEAVNIAGDFICYENIGVEVPFETEVLSESTE